MSEAPNPAYVQEQAAHRGNSHPSIHEAALIAARPVPGLSWLDIGCGTGSLLGAVARRWAPSSLTGIDLIDMLADDLRDVVNLIVAPAEQGLPFSTPFDRVLLVESLESLEAPWSMLRLAACLVAPGGRIVVTVPNVASARNRLGLLARGELSAFRPNNPAQRTPVLPHVVEAVMRYEGLTPIERTYAMADVIPLTRGRLWPDAARRRAPCLTSVSVVMAADAQP